MSKNSFSQFEVEVSKAQNVWLITGVAGFIGSNLLEALLKLGQKVVGLDNFSTGSQDNLDDVKNSVTADLWHNFSFLHGDIRDLETCNRACQKVDFVLHQAALGSVPRSIKDPLTSHLVNVDGFLNMILAARDCAVRRFVYASSSSVYGDHKVLPKKEGQVGRPLSPYAATKSINELYAEIFSRSYDFPSVGLRYFNVFGPRQNSKSEYAAVIPLWMELSLKKQACKINGDGTTSRDFCFIKNVVEANLKAALSYSQKVGEHCVLNVGGERETTLNDLCSKIRSEISLIKNIEVPDPIYGEFRAGDVKHSLADISLAKQLLDFTPTVSVEEGLKITAAWFAKQN